ncbi:hypothetical protein TanjilG_07057 [Lupinus angustifolius]|uniref:Uncharacterized protein n=1 Tax=Lupinus angustifolius TaxID=3871 RepID=A0A4P1QXX4_LUPAN|nr:hypothetical protein TanjilG_07057 [Lupinus angustifolius]
MEGNGRVPSPPEQPLSFYSYGRPNQPYRHLVSDSTYPLTISVCNGTKIFFTITNHSVSIISPNNNAPYLHRIINDHHNNAPQFFSPHYNNGPQHHNSNGPQYHDHNGAQYRVNNEAEDDHFFLHVNGFRNNNGARDGTLFLPDQNTNGAQDNDLFREDDDDDDDEENEEDRIDLMQFHGLFLPHLPALPAYIHVTSNNRTFALLVTVNNTIHVIHQALPIFPPHNNDGNYHVINQPIAPPFSMAIFFNRANSNTFINIRIEIVSNSSIFIRAESCIGTTDWAAMLDFNAAHPYP